MARRRPGQDNDALFSSEQNLEQQAELMERMADRVSSHIGRNFDSLMDRVESRLNQEVSGLQRQLAEQSREQRESRQEFVGFRERWVTNIMNQTGRGQAFDTDWRSVGSTIGREMVNGLMGVLDTWFVQPIRQGFTEMSSAYEANFTAIAGRMGTDNKATHDEMHSAVKTLTQSSANAAINANKELIPELRKVAEEGFKGSEAIAITLENSIDSKIMPWLDTHSDAWVNMQYNMSSLQLQTLKGQQLALQESRTGNRLLQSGVIDNLTSELAPALVRIDYNTGGANGLSLEYKKMLYSYVEDGKMTPQEAYSVVQRVISAQQNPASAIDSGNYFDVMLGTSGLLGLSPSQSMSTTMEGIAIGAGAGNFASFVNNALGIPSIGGWSTADTDQSLIKGIIGTQYVDLTEDALDEYIQRKLEADETVTATAKWDNKIQNQTTDLLYGVNQIPHGVEVAEQILTVTQRILAAVLGSVVGNFVTNMVGRGGGQNGLNFQNIIGSNGRGLSGLGEGLMGGRAKSAIGNAARTSGLTGAQSAGMITGGLIQATGGVILAKEGAKAFSEEATKEQRLRNAAGGTNHTDAEAVDKGLGGLAVAAGGTAAVAGGIAAAGGIAGATGATGGLVAAGAAAGPVGWIALGVGAVALAAKGIYDYATRLSGAAKQTEEEFSTWAEEYKQSTQDYAQSAVVAYSKIKNLTEAQDKQKVLIEESGLSQELVNKYLGEQPEKLDSLAQAASDAALKLSGMADGEAQNITTEAVTEMQTMSKDALDGMYSAFMKDIQSNGGKASSQTLGEIQSMINSIEDTDDRKVMQEEFDYFKKDNKLDKIELDYLFGKSAVHKAFNISQWGGPSNANFYDRTPTIADDQFLALAATKDVDIDTSKYEALQQYRSEIATIRIAARNYTSAKSDEEREVEKDIISQTLESLPKSDDKLYPELSASLKPYLEKTGQSYAVGTPYVSHDQLAVIHQGEAILTAQENKNNLMSLLGVRTDQLEVQRSTSNDIIKAIQAQTETLKAVLEKLGISLQKSDSTTSSHNPFANPFNSNVTLSPAIANTRSSQ